MIIEISDIPAWIRAERQRQGISVADMAKMAYSCVDSIYDMENPRRRRNPLSSYSMHIIDLLGYKLQVQIVKKEN